MLAAEWRAVSVARQKSRKRFELAVAHSRPGTVSGIPGLAAIVWQPGDLLPGSLPAPRARLRVWYPEVLMGPHSRRPKAWSP
jgi:hypothetical protein